MSVEEKRLAALAGRIAVPVRGVLQVEVRRRVRRKTRNVTFQISSCGPTSFTVSQRTIACKCVYPQLLRMALRSS